MSTRRRIGLSALVLIAIAIGLAALGNRKEVEQALVPDAPYPVTPTIAPCDSDCERFVASIAPSLSVVVSEGTALAALGKSRSRDVLELTIRMNRFQDSSAEFEQALVDNPVPVSLSPAIAEIRTELSNAQVAIDASIAAIRSIDWDALGAAVDQFDSAIQNVAALSSTMNLELMDT